MDWGKFREGAQHLFEIVKKDLIIFYWNLALDYGHHQLGISEELDNPQMRSEAYLNLARAHERLGKQLSNVD